MCRSSRRWRPALPGWTKRPGFRIALSPSPAGLAALARHDLGGRPDVVMLPPHVFCALLRGQARDQVLDHASTACLQDRLAIDNADDNLLTRMFAMGYAVLFDAVTAGLMRTSLPVLLGGTSNHFRTTVLRQVGGWDAWNVTEDADLALRPVRSGYRVAEPPSDTLEEAPARLPMWFRQHVRCMKGFMQTLVTHKRSPRRLFGNGHLAGAGPAGLVRRHAAEHAELPDLPDQCRGVAQPVRRARSHQRHGMSRHRRLERADRRWTDRHHGPGRAGRGAQAADRADLVAAPAPDLLPADLIGSPGCAGRVCPRAKPVKQDRPWPCADIPDAQACRGQRRRNVRPIDRVNQPALKAAGRSRFRSGRRCGLSGPGFNVLHDLAHLGGIGSERPPQQPVAGLARHRGRGDDRQIVCQFRQHVRQGPVGDRASIEGPGSGATTSMNCRNW